MKYKTWQYYYGKFVNPGLDISVGNQEECDKVLRQINFYRPEALWFQEGFQAAGKMCSAIAKDAAQEMEESIS